MIAERGIFVDGVDDRFPEVARMGSGEAHAANTGNTAHAVEQRGEIPSGWSKRQASSA